MIVNADVALIAMIENKSMYLEMIDFMDKNGDGDEIRMSMYRQKLRALLDKVGPLDQARPAKDVPAARRKLEAALSIENLDRAGLVVHIDPSRGVMVLQSFVTDMFRAFDGSRLRRLSNADFELIRAAFNRLPDVFLSLHVLDPDDPDFKEHYTALRGEVRSAIAKMSESVSALQSRLERLGEIVDQMRFDDIDEVSKAQEALGEINSIYLRNILPALQFLAEDVDLKDGKPAMAALTQVGDLFFSAGLIKHASWVYYQIETIRSYRRDIDVVRGSLMRYVQQSEAHRRAYDRIEKSWNTLYTHVSQLHDGQLRGNQIKSTDPIFDNWPTFNGVKFRRFDPKVEWAEKNHRLHLVEHLRTTLPDVQVPTIKPAVTPGVQFDPAGEQKRAQDERMVEIGKFVDCWPAQACDDAHAQLHEYLKGLVSSYELADLLVGINWLSIREGCVLAPMFEMATITTDLEVLHYYRQSLELST